MDMFQLTDYCDRSPAVTEGYSPAPSLPVSKNASPTLERASTVSYEAVCLGGAEANAVDLPAVPRKKNKKYSIGQDAYNKLRWQSIVDNPDFHEHVKEQKRAWYRKVTGSSGNVVVQKRKFRKDMTALEWDQHKLEQIRRYRKAKQEKLRNKRNAFDGLATELYGDERVNAFDGHATELYGDERVKAWSRAGLEQGIAPWSWESLVYAAEVLEPEAMEELRVEITVEQRMLWGRGTGL